MSLIVNVASKANSKQAVVPNDSIYIDMFLFGINLNRAPTIF